MKKTILILLLLTIPLISAVNIDMKNQFSQGETLIAKISGNFLEPIQKENIFFYKGHVKIPLDYDLAKINNEYYLYAQLGSKESNNYSLRIEDINYMQGANVVSEDVIKNFTITNDIADFKINPGFIIATHSFKIEIQNLQDSNIQVDINENKTETGPGFFESLFGNLQESTNSISLASGEIKNLEFDLGNKTSFNFVRLSTKNITYEIPVYVFVSLAINAQENTSVNSVVTENTTNITNTTSQSIPQENNIFYNQAEIKTVSTKTCAEENGTICGEKEKCNGTIEYSSDAVCCLGNCEIIQKNNTGKILGWSMIVLIILAIMWFFLKKYKYASKEVNLLKIAKGKK